MTSNSDVSCHTLYKFSVCSVCCPAHIKTVFYFMPNTSQKLFCFTSRCSYSALQIVPGSRHLRNGHRIFYKPPEKYLSDVRSGYRRGWHVNLRFLTGTIFQATACYRLLSRHCRNVLAPPYIEKQREVSHLQSQYMQIEHTHKIKSLVYSYMFRQNFAILRASTYQYLKLARIYCMTVVIHTVS